MALLLTGPAEHRALHVSLFTPTKGRRTEQLPPRPKHARARACFFPCPCPQSSTQSRTSIVPRRPAALGRHTTSGQRQKAGGRGTPPRCGATQRHIAATPTPTHATHPAARLAARPNSVAPCSSDPAERSEPMLLSRESPRAGGNKHDALVIPR